MADRPPRLAVLIDADNTSPKVADGLFDEVAKIGEASLRRIYGDFSKGQQAGWEKVLQKHAKARILVVAENFQGWEKGGEWADFSFQEKNDTKIECMAIVGDKRWKELVLAFVGQGLREFPIEYFEHGELAKARAWLKAH